MCAAITTSPAAGSQDDVEAIKPPRLNCARLCLRLPCRLLPDEARAEVEQQLETIDADWRDCIMIRESRPNPSGRVATRSHTSGRPFTKS